MNLYNKENNLKKDETSLSLNLYDKCWKYVCEQGPYLSVQIILFVVGMFYSHFSPIRKANMTSSDFATVSFHRQGFAPKRSINQQIHSKYDSLVTSEPVVKCAASSSKLKRAQQLFLKRIFVMTQTKPLLKIASAQMHTSTNQFIPRALSDLSSLGHIHINRKTKDEWKKKSKKWVRKPDTGFPVRKRITLEKTNRTKRLLAPKCQAVPGGSDLDGGLTVYEKAFKYSCKKNFTLLYNNMKMPIIEDPFLIMTFQTAYEPLIDIKLCQHDQQKIIHLALRKTCRYSKVNSTTIFTKENRNIFSQETYGLYLLLTKRFELQDSFINKASHSFNSLFDWSKLSSPWGELKQTSFQLLKADLALELVDLDTDLGVQDFFFVFAAKARSLAPQYFERRVSENLQIINEGIELAQSKRADKHAIIISSAKKLNIVRSQTLVQEFDKTFPNLGSYKELFCSVTGEQRIVSDRKPFDFLNLVLPD